MEVDVIWSKLPKSFYHLQPIVYKDGETFLCLLGPDPIEGVVGYGSNAEEAVRDWHQQQNELIQDRKNDSEFVKNIRTLICDSWSDSDNSYKGEF